VGIRGARQHQDMRGMVIPTWLSGRPSSQVQAKPE
jgi:hypothetical protein